MYITIYSVFILKNYNLNKSDYLNQRRKTNTKNIQYKLYNITTHFSNAPKHTKSPILIKRISYYTMNPLWHYLSKIRQIKIKSNHFYCHITTAHVPWWVKFLRACSRQCRNNLHIDSTYLQTYTEDNVQNTHTYTQYTQCVYMWQTCGELLHSNCLNWWHLDCRTNSHQCATDCCRLLHSDNLWVDCHWNWLHHGIYLHYSDNFFACLDFSTHLTPQTPDTTARHHDVLTDTALLQYTNK